jgi:hypothetical protein
MKALVKKFGYVALVLGAAVMALGSTGCVGPHGTLQRPGWILPKR